MKLCYSKDCDTEVMQDLLNLNPLSDEFISVLMGDHKMGHDNIIITLSRPFYSHEKDSITSTIESYSIDHPIYLRKQLKNKVSTPAMIAGQDLVAEYAAMNLFAQKSVPQYFTLFAVTKNLMDYLMSGSLELAAYELGQVMANLPEDGSITEPECLEFLRRIQVELKKLRG